MCAPSVCAHELGVSGGPCAQTHVCRPQSVCVTLSLYLLWVLGGWKMFIYRLLYTLIDVSCVTATTSAGHCVHTAIVQRAGREHFSKVK